MNFDLPSPTPTPTTPIADLSYRNYDGPLHTRALRWWVIAVAMMRLSVSSLAFKIVAGLSIIPYLFVTFLLYLRSQFPIPPGPQQLAMGSIFDNTVGQKYALQFYNAQGYQLLLLLILTLIAGAGSIASDNRSNALQVYLSKPITKGDYLIGKWVGLFLTLFTVAFAPALLFYLYCLLSYTSDGFLREEPMLFLHMFLVTALTAAIFSSLMIGISAWSKSARIAGAILASLYFASQAIAWLGWRVQSDGDPSKNILTLHSSLGGVLSGLSQGIYHITIHTSIVNKRRMLNPVFAPGRRNGGLPNFIIPIDITPPDIKIMLLVALALIVVGVVAARMRINAVEVVRG